MKDDNLPSDNETVEDGGGCYVAGSREEYNAYLNYEDVQKELETTKAEITRLRSEVEKLEKEKNEFIQLYRRVTKPF